MKKLIVLTLALLSLTMSACGGAAGGGSNAPSSGAADDAKYASSVLKLYLPKVADTLMPMESAKMRMAARMLKRVRGDGMGFMSWRAGANDLFLMRMSRDELRGTAALWSTLFLD